MTCNGLKITHSLSRTSPKLRRLLCKENQRSVWSFHTRKRLLVGLGTRQFGISWRLRHKQLISSILHWFFWVEFLESASASRRFSFLSSSQSKAPGYGALQTLREFRYSPPLCGFLFGCGFAALCLRASVVISLASLSLKGNIIKIELVRKKYHFRAVAPGKLHCAFLRA